MPILPYDRDAAVTYAHTWAYRRNPAFYDFSPIGGDCTNFASQCIYAGAGIMNFTPTYGWYYRSANDRTPSWTGVQYLYDFLTQNLGPGPFATEVSLSGLEPGDVVQLAIDQDIRYQHTPVVVRVDSPTLTGILVAAHSNDVDFRPLSTYQIRKLRCLHIDGVRSQM
jgi:hypothetical protein